MNTKLTLTIDKEVIEKAKFYAHTKGRSLSDIVENYLKAVSTENEFVEFEISETVQELKGSVSPLDE